jgi:4-amino-4-deoxy-L-arabinose transferase-like glycosyltransferase
MDEGGAARWRDAALPWIGMVAVVSVYLLGASAFLPHQTLCLDEATQLSGVGLGPSKVVSWLAGWETFDFDQYPDRSPPLSYWLDWAWSRVIGDRESSLRWFGVTCVAAAVAMIYQGARCAFGVVAAWGAGLIAALSPHVIMTSVGIRPYPLFLFWSAAAFLLMVQLVSSSNRPTESRMGEATEPIGCSRDERLRFIGLALCLAGAVTTHFFGVVLAGAVLTALFIESRSRLGWRRPLLAVTGCVWLAVLSITPFILASMRAGGKLVGPGPSLGARLVGVERLLVRLILHPTLLLNTLAEVTALVAAFLLLLATGFVPRGHRGPIRAIVLALAAGLAAATCGRLLMNRFDALTSSYNVWMRPGFIILLAAGLAARARPARLTAATAVGLLIIAEAFGVYQLAAHGDYFAYGPHRRVATLIRGLGVDTLAVVHDFESPRIEFLYRPLRYEFGRAMPHYRFAGLSEGRTVVGHFMPPSDRVWSTAALPYRYLLVVKTRAMDTTDVARQIRDGDQPLGDGPVAQELRGSPDWRFDRRVLFFATDSAEISVFERQANTSQAMSPPVRRMQ